MLLTEEGASMGVHGGGGMGGAASWGKIPLWWDGERGMRAEGTWAHISTQKRHM